MTRAIRTTSLVAAITLATSAAAAPRKVLVLPIDGDADLATRTKLLDEVQKLAKQIDGQVSAGDATFQDTASAVGCNPAQPKCADEVLTTLSVDEIVWGTATTQNGQVTVVVHRAAKGAEPREVTTTLAAQDPPERADAGLQSLFGEPGAANAVPLGSGGGSATAGSAALGTTEILPAADMHDRNLGLGLAVGGGAAIVLGFALWESESSLQDQINAHPTQTAQDIADLKAIEDHASNYALLGNVMAVAGLAVGTAGAYYLWRDHQAKTMSATVTPVRPDQGTGLTFVLRGTW